MRVTPIIIEPYSAKNKQDQTPAQFAIANGSETFAELLSEYG